MIVAIALFVVPLAADKAKNKTPYIVGPAFIGAFCLLMSALLSDPVLQFAFLCIAAAGIFAGQPVFWSLPGRFLKGAGAAAGIAAINSVGNLGGFVAQNVVPWIRIRPAARLRRCSSCLLPGACRSAGHHRSA